MRYTSGRVIALSGGIGGAKLALGLARIMPADRLTLIANTGDDFEHLGLAISPDVDTLMYTLAGLANQELGWGRRDETWTFMSVLEQIGGETWFRLGDGDLAVHVERTRRLAAGERLTAITTDLGRRLGAGPDILPMCDEPVRTRVCTRDGWLDFQDYFVRRRAAPEIAAIRFDGADAARLTPEIGAAFDDPDLAAIIICPSNPLISIEPILAVPGLRERIASSPAPVVAVSPIIAGKAVKGPTAAMMLGLGLEATARGVAARYRDLIDAYIVDPADAGSLGAVDFEVVPAQTSMTSLSERENLARVVLDVAAQLERAQTS